MPNGKTETIEEIFAKSHMKKAMENLNNAILNCNPSSARLAALAIDEAKFSLVKKGITDTEYSKYKNRVIKSVSIFEHNCVCNKK